MIRLLLFPALAITAAAHPVAQGSLTLDVRADHIAARARVSNEQVFVAGTLGKNPAPAASLDALFAAHGAYLLEHLRLAADGQPLAGRVEKVTPPEDKTTAGFTLYDLRFDLAATPREISARQDLMNEINFAPGNPWEATFVVRHARDGMTVRDGILFTHREPLVLATAAAAAPAHEGAFTSYLSHGVHHILVGWDHLLFMAALVLAATGLWDLVKVVTAFTLAHTITLTLSVLDVVRLQSSIVEPIIALSIVVVAAQNVFWPSSARGRGRLLAAFAFGLFHGLGFAGGLLEAMQELPALATGLALAGFSIGVELGHQAVVLPVFAGMKILRTAPRRAFTLRYGSALIAIAGAWYLVAALQG